MSEISFSWYGVRQFLDAGCRTTRDGQFVENFHNGWKNTPLTYHHSDASGNALRFIWKNITHVKFSFFEDENKLWIPLNESVEQILQFLKNGEDWYRTARDREWRDGVYFATRDIYSNHSDMLGFEKISQEDIQAIKQEILANRDS